MRERVFPLGRCALPELRRRERQRQSGPAYVIGGAFLAMVYVYIVIWFVLVMFG